MYIVREWENAEGVSHHFRQSNPSSTSIFELLGKLISLDRQQYQVWLEHASAHFQPACAQTLSARKTDAALAVVRNAPSCPYPGPLLPCVLGCESVTDTATGKLLDLHFA